MNHGKQLAKLALVKGNKMATAPVNLNDAKSVILSVVNQMENTSITVDDVDFGIPQRANGTLPVRNTKIVLSPKQSSGYYGNKTIWYNRIHISELGPITVQKGTATSMWGLIPAINAKYGIYLSTTDIIDAALPVNQTGEIAVTLNISQASLMFYAGPVIQTPGFNPGTPASILVPAMWDPVIKSSLITIDSTGYEISSAAGISMIRTNTSFVDGKRYFEFTNNSSNGLVGFGTASANTTTLLGSDINTWSLDTFTGLFSHNGVTLLDLSSQLTLLEDNPVGFMLDLDTDALTLILTGDVRVDVPNIGLPSNSIFVMAGNKSATLPVTNIEANFGNQAFTFQVPFGYYPGFGTGGEPVVPTAGTLISQNCVGFDLVGTYANGSGGTYSAILQTNSVTCGFGGGTTQPPTTTLVPTTAPPSTTSGPTTTAPPTTTISPTTTTPPTTTSAPVVLPTISNDVVVTGNSTHILPLGTIQAILIGAGDPGTDAVTETLTEDTPIYLVQNSLATPDYWIAVINNDTATEAIRIKNTGEVESSTNGTTWTATGTVDLTLGSTVAAADLSTVNIYSVFVNGYYYIFTSYGSYFRSNDAGATWTQLTGLGLIAGIGNVVKLLYGNSTYVLFADNNNLAVSTDGLAFTFKDYFTDYGIDYQDGFLDIAFNGTVFAGLHPNETEAITTTDFVTLSKNTLPTFTILNAATRITNIGGTFITSGNTAIGAGEYLTSPDGSTWTLRTTTLETFDSYFKNINGILLLVNDVYNSSYYSYGSANGLVSTDGINWLKIRPANDPTYTTSYKLPLPYYLDGKFRCMPFTDEGSAIDYGDYYYTGTPQVTTDVMVLTPATTGASTEAELLGTTYTYTGSNSSTAPTATQNTVTVNPLNTDTVTYNVSTSGSLTIREVRNEYTSTLQISPLDQYTVNEGSGIDAAFVLNGALERDVTFIFNLDYETSTALDFTSIQYAIGTDPARVYSDIADGDSIILPEGEALITVRITTATDALVEGDTTFSVSLTKAPGTVVVLNTAPVTKTMTIINMTAPSTTLPPTTTVAPGTTIPPTTTPTPTIPVTTVPPTTTATPTTTIPVTTTPAPSTTVPPTTTPAPGLTPTAFDTAFNTAGTYSNSDRTVALSASSDGFVRTVFSATTGEWYAEITVGSGDIFAGIVSNSNANTGNFLGTNDGEIAIYSLTGGVWENSTVISTEPATLPMTTVGIYLNADTRTVTFITDTNSGSPTVFGPLTGTDAIHIALSSNSGGASAVELNAGQNAFTYTKPATASPIFGS